MTTLNEMLKGTNTKIIDLNKSIHYASEVCLGEEDLKIDQKKDGTFDVNLIILNKPSRNNSIYDREGFIKSLTHNKIISERIQNNKWWGEENHPPARSPEGRILTKEERAERIKQIDSKNVQHRINRWWVEGDVVRGNIEPAPPLGKIFEEKLQMGMNPAFSVRSLTPEWERVTRDNSTYLLKKFYIDVVTFDGVDIGGFENATAKDPAEFAKSHNNRNDGVKISQESYMGDSFEHKESYSKIIDMLKEDEGLECLSELFNFDLAEYGKITILGEEGIASIVTPTGVELNVHINSLALNSALSSF